ncbi:MAG TPA: hypothetical protein PLL30_07105 [Candidatus Krumholzibacteria bacterium]|nr:hypothetical protein [Candidatus Krumholzibacteria bacterium]HPD71525.1 hypothetical protein [Candidatus Krumholzibacteria bacterium]HRY41542.1 hypothetical protein [Candidatus Krumholzibacteria bacterium]
MFKFLVLLLAVLWFLPRLLRLLGTRDGDRRQEIRAQRRTPRDDRLQDLNRQDISDADFEEIPPEK